MWFIHPEMFFWCFWDWSIFICGFRGPTHLNHRLQLWAPGRIPFSAFASVYLPVCVWVICLSTGWAESSSLGGLYIGLVVHTVPVRAFKEDQLSPGCVTNDLMPTLQIMLVSLSHVSTYQLHLKKQSCQLDSTTYFYFFAIQIKWCFSYMLGREGEARLFIWLQSATSL